ncbi:MAG: carboxymuconolactone decarboxylase family protein [Candidatus Dormibacteraeota bacterium]|nr:carboxymuconolactone decarboxylase family protein [Candidatus Dormibacteraeota bacterium]
MALRVKPIQPSDASPPIRAVLEQQARTWGAPLINNLLYARRPAIFRAVRAMWGAIDSSGLLDPQIKAMLNRRVAIINGCPF